MWFPRSLSLLSTAVLEVDVVILRLRPCRRPVYFGLLFFWVCFFSNLSAENCAGSLVTGCSFDVTFFTIHCDLGRGCCQLNMSFGMLAASTLPPWGTIERSRGTSDHKSRDLGVQAWISADFGWIARSHFQRVLTTFGTDKVFLLCVCTGHVFEWFRGLLLDVWDSRIKHLV